MYAYNISLPHQFLSDFLSFAGSGNPTTLVAGLCRFIDFPLPSLLGHSGVCGNQKHAKQFSLTLAFDLPLRFFGMVVKSCTSWKRWFIPSFMGFQASFWRCRISFIHSMETTGWFDQPGLWLWLHVTEAANLSATRFQMLGRFFRVEFRCTVEALYLPVWNVSDWACHSINGVTYWLFTGFKEP